MAFLKRLYKQWRFGRYVSTRCWSIHDGCACDQKKDHKGPHKCPVEECADHLWTSEDARQWHMELLDDINNGKYYDLQDQGDEGT